MRSAPASTLLAALLAGCASGGAGAPWGQLRDVRIERADSRPRDGLKLALHAEYRLDNPLSRPIDIPAHRAWLEATPTDATGAVSGPAVRIAEVRVPPRELPAEGRLVVPYDFLLDLDAPALAPVLGTDARYAFRAEADVDLPAELLASVREKVGAALPEGARAAGEDPAVAQLVESASRAAVAAIRAQLPAAFSDGKMRLAHEGTIRIPKLPEIRFGGSAPALALIGPQRPVDLSGPVEAVQAASSGFVQMLDGALERSVEVVPSMTLGDLLEERLGLPRAAADLVLDVANAARGQTPRGMSFAERTALSGLLTAFGVRPSSADAEQRLTRATAIGVRALSLLEVLGRFDPEAAEKFRQLKAGLRGLAEDERLRGEVFVPTAMPEGVVVRLPFVLRNANQFPIALPTLRAELLGGAAGFATVTALPVEGRPEAEELAPLAEVPMRFEAEIRWSNIGQTLIGLAGGDALDPEALRIEGQLGVDLGYGLMEVPIPLEGGDLTSAASARARGGRRVSRAPR
jgi:hypothetical protein